MRLPEDHSGARNDEHLIELWLNGRPDTTKAMYGPLALVFLAWLSPKGLRETTVADLVAWIDTLVGTLATKARKIATIKSLFSYAHRTGYCVFNIGQAVRVPKLPSKLHERIVDEAVIKDILGIEGSARDIALVRFLYISGARISEVVGLSFKDLRGTRVSLNGKGSKMRTIVVPAAVVAALQALRGPEDGPEAPVFQNRRRGRLSDRYARIIVKRIAKAAGAEALSPHWLRHAHASHALDRGAPIHLVKESLGHANVSSTSRYLHAKPNEGSGQYLDA